MTKIIRLADKRKVTNKEWLELINNLILKGLESEPSNTLDIHLEELTDDGLIIRFNDISNSTFIIKRY